MTGCRIVYVVNRFPELSQTFVAGELTELRRRGTEFRILSLNEPTDELRHDIVIRTGLDRLTVYGPANFPAALEEFRPELIHAHFATEPAAAARTLAAELGLPFTFTAHGYDIYRDPPSDFDERAAAAGAVVTVSEANAHYISESFGVPLARIYVIPCGVDTTLFCPPNGESEVEAAARSQFAAEQRLIVCVARLVRVKNLRLLLEACSILRNRGIKFRCVIVGEGPYRDELEGARAKLALEELVEMTGAAEQTHVLAWWRRASIAVLSSESEGMPISLMEAGACGVPVVATSVGGIPELIEHEVTGLLTAPGDARSFADNIERLLSDPNLRAKMGAAARRRIEERFTLVRQMDQMVDIWSQCLSLRS